MGCDVEGKYQKRKGKILKIKEVYIPWQAWISEC